MDDCPLRRGRGQDEGYFAPAGATFFRSAAKEGKDAPGEPFHKGSPGPFLTAKGLRPIGSPAGAYVGRETEGRKSLRKQRKKEEDGLQRVAM